MQACSPTPLGAAALASALDEEALAALLLPVSFANTKVSRSVRRSVAQPVGPSVRRSVGSNLSCPCFRLFSSKVLNDPLLCFALRRPRPAHICVCTFFFFPRWNVRCSPLYWCAFSMNGPRNLGVPVLVAFGLFFPFLFSQAKHITMVCERLSKAEGDREAGAIPSTVKGTVSSKNVRRRRNHVSRSVVFASQRLFYLFLFFYCAFVGPAANDSLPRFLLFLETII